VRADARPHARKNRKRSLLHPPTPSVVSPADPTPAKTGDLPEGRAPSRGNTLRAHGVTNKSHRRDGEAAGTVSGQERRRCLQMFAAVVTSIGMGGVAYKDAVV